MFDLKRPCVNCPFRKGQGHLFQLPSERLKEIVEGIAFQCHKTLEFTEDGENNHGDNPQQCAGLMAVLHKEGRHNQIMQIAERTGFLNPDDLKLEDAYDSLEEVFKAHSGKMA